MKAGEIKWHLKNVSDDSEVYVLYGAELLRIVKIENSAPIKMVLVAVEDEEEP